MLNANQFLQLSRPFLHPIPKSTIPRLLFTTWHTSSLPPLMKRNLIQLARDNPEFKPCFYDEPACERFISDNFPVNVSDAYKRLIPNAYKADLWRLCILYIYGGIYVDIKFKCVNGFRFIHLADNEYFVRDIDRSGGGIYNALMVSKPRNPLLYKAIQKIVSNVKTQFYGDSCLHPTGPMLLNEFPIPTSLALKTLDIPDIRQVIFIVFRNHIILTPYREYRDEQAVHQGTEHYAVLWNKQAIYAHQAL